MNRQLPKEHPIYDVLQPHLEGTAFINYFAQQVGRCFYHDANGYHSQRKPTTTVTTPNGYTLSRDTPNGNMLETVYSNAKGYIPIGQARNVVTLCVLR